MNRKEVRKEWNRIILGMAAAAIKFIKQEQAPLKKDTKP